MQKLNRPKWHKELDIYKAFRSTFIVEGNVNDVQQWIDEENDSFSPKPLELYMDDYLRINGYEYVIFYNRIDGFYCKRGNIVEILKKLLHEDTNVINNVNEASAIIRRLMSNMVDNCAIIINYGSLLFSDISRLSDGEWEAIARLFLATGESKTKNSNQNLLFFMVNKVNDIPAWFYLSNPYVKILHISKPSKELRMRMMSKLRNRFYDCNNVSEEEMERIMDEFGVLTEGFSNIEINGFLTLCQLKKISIGKIKEAINLYKYGEAESKWDTLSLEVLKDAENILMKDVIGQDKAVRKVVNVLKRARLGLSSIQTNSIGHPKGVLFFAGPTGTGKTELAKKIAKLVFGDEKALIRFDMSEYSQPHSDQRLIGAPPGYVGYENGGQLTNAVKENPFSVLLFDEIDKADTSILNKFLQILEDGQITDSAGETVYFSECLIIFTSNIGVDKNNKDGIQYKRLSKDMDYDEIEKALIYNVELFFKAKGKPEVYNRIGSNVVAFNYIHKDVAQEILKSKVSNIINKLYKEKEISLVLDEYLYKLSELLEGYIEYGGRGVVNMLEELLINPLSQVLFDNEDIKGKTIYVKDINKEGGLIYHIEQSMLMREL